jgi:phage baseplate assembly protein W
MAIDITNEAKTVATSKGTYRDLDLLFRAHPQTGDVVVRTDAEAVKRSVRNIILTNHYERPFKPGFGGSIRDLLFELNTSRQLKKVQRRLKDMLEAFEPRVKDVVVSILTQDSNEVNLNIQYSIINIARNQALDLTVTRAR